MKWSNHWRCRMRRILIPLLMAIAVAVGLPAGAGEDAFLQAMKKEVKREFDVLKKNSPPVYYLAFRGQDEEVVRINAKLGSLSTDSHSKRRRVDAILRIGSPQLDSSHEMKKRFDFRRYARVENLPLDDDVDILRQDL